MWAREAGKGGEMGGGVGQGGGQGGVDGGGVDGGAPESSVGATRRSLVPPRLDLAGDEGGRRGGCGPGRHQRAVWEQQGVQLV